MPCQMTTVVEIGAASASICWATRKIAMLMIKGCIRCRLFIDHSGGKRVTSKSGGIWLRKSTRCAITTTT